MMKKFIYHILRFLNDCIDLFILLVFILIFLIGIYGMADTISIFSSAQDKGVLKYKPKANEVLTEDIKNNVAWISIEDSLIDYPVMQGLTNEEYLNKDPYGNYSLSGSIFLDYRNNFDFSDPYSLVYGHHMEQGLMFGSLDEWLDEKYFNSHLHGTLTTKTEIYDLTVYAIMETKATVKEMFHPIDVPYQQTFEYINTNYRYINKEVQQPEHLVALSTCKYPDSDERTILVCNLTESGNHVTTSKITAVKP